MSHFDSLLAKIRTIPPLSPAAPASKPLSAKKDMFGSFKGLVSSFDSKLAISSPSAPGAPAARRASVSGGSTTATIAVIGLGYVGLPLSCIFHEAGFNVVAFDVDSAKVNAFASSTCYLPHLQSEWDRVCCSKSARFKASCSDSDLSQCDVFIVCVPTPLGPNQEPDLSHVTSATQLVARNLRPGCLFVLESTSFPGTTEEVCLPILCSSGRTVGSDLFVAYSSEREDPGNALHSMRSIPKVVGGYDEPSLALADALYSTAFAAVHKVSSCRVAEASKIVENVYAQPFPRCIFVTSGQVPLREHRPRQRTENDI
jgi:UDP-N-acetyl-D-glucosamine dehydrogenase